MNFKENGIIVIIIKEYVVVFLKDETKMSEVRITKFINIILMICNKGASWFGSLNFDLNRESN